MRRTWNSIAAMRLLTGRQSVDHRFNIRVAGSARRGSPVRLLAPPQYDAVQGPLREALETR